ncbi:unnamed protein product [Polarella glacialis]|nr:unnamed protein product [Polarella glacialis]
MSSGLVYLFEHPGNPAFPNFFVSLYFTLTTLTTVGFGDITPISAEGRFIVSVSILAGATLIPVQLSSLANSFGEELSDKNKATLPEIALGPWQCRHCNEPSHRADAAFCFRCGVALRPPVSTDATQDP